MNRMRAKRKTESEPIAKSLASRGKVQTKHPPKHALPSIPADQALSFLRETRGISTWTARDMANSLRIGGGEAKRAIAVLEMQGYVNPFKSDQFMTTSAGESVSHSQAPRYTRDRIDRALAVLRSRIAEINRDDGAPFRITQAVAFGDFLSERTRFQPVEIGIQLQPRKPAAISIARKGATREQFLKQLRDKAAVVQFRRYQTWMSARSHQNLLR